MSGYGAKDLLSFLEYALEKGLGKKETLKTRIVSVGRIVDAVGEDEFGDVREADVDHIMERFMNLEGTKFSPGSLASYKSRLNSSVADFLRYKENPTAYRPARQRTARNRTEVAASKNGIANDATLDGEPDVPKSPERKSIADSEASTFPIPLRQGLVVKIVGLPHDLSQSEAQRIANVVKAMAVLEE
jgi:hypothetical protein